jgi:hypothetical protein
VFGLFPDSVAVFLLLETEYRIGTLLASRLFLHVHFSEFMKCTLLNKKSVQFQCSAQYARRKNVAENFVKISYLSSAV